MLPKNCLLFITAFLFAIKLSNYIKKKRNERYKERGGESSSRENEPNKANIEQAV
jgi:hypothetical protein